MLHEDVEPGKRVSITASSLLLLVQSPAVGKSHPSKHKKNNILPCRVLYPCSERKGKRRRCVARARPPRPPIAQGEPRRGARDGVRSRVAAMVPLGADLSPPRRALLCEPVFKPVPSAAARTGPPRSVDYRGRRPSNSPRAADAAGADAWPCGARTAGRSACPRWPTGLPRASGTSSRPLVA